MSFYHDSMYASAVAPYISLGYNLTTSRKPYSTTVERARPPSKSSEVLVQSVADTKARILEAAQVLFDKDGVADYRF